MVNGQILILYDTAVKMCAGLQRDSVGVIQKKKIFDFLKMFLVHVNQYLSDNLFQSIPHIQ